MNGSKNIVVLLMKKKMENRQPPKAPLNRFIYEDDTSNEFCPECKSSFRKRYWLGIIYLGKSKGCINPNCSNYNPKTNLKFNEIFASWKN